MENDNIDVSIIIVNYNTSNLINDCIQSIFLFTNDINYEIIIVDNATEKLSDVIIYASDARVKLLQLKENIGFGRANNEGAKLARGRNLFCLNPDTLLQNNAVKILSDFLDSHPKCGACGGNLYDINLQPNLSYKLKFPGFFEETDQFLRRLLSKILYRGNYLFNQTDSIREVAYINGADLMIKKAIFNHLGGFNPQIFLYYEETELQYRMTRLGYDIYSVPFAKIIHLEGKSFNVSRHREKNALISRKLYYKETKSPIYSKCINSYYKIITLTALFISRLSKNKRLEEKLKQRIEILREIDRLNE